MAEQVGVWSEEKIEDARRMLGAGLTLKAVAQHFGVTGDTVKCKVDQLYQERRREQTRLARAVNRPYEKSAKSDGRYYVQRVPDPDCVAARLAEIPRFDRRDMTARMFGDPLPERSALYARQHTDRET